MSVEMSELNQIIARCSGIIDDPYRRLAEKKDAETRYFGYSCIFAPEEVLHAAGFVPIRLFADYKGTRFTDKYLPAQSCEFARNLLETFRNRQLDFLEGCIFTHCCDILWGCFGGIKRFWQKPIYYLNTPLKGTHSYACDFLCHELEKFVHYLEKTFQVEITQENLEKSAAVYRQNHRLLKQLQRLLTEGYISGSDYLIVQKAGYFIPKQAHNQILLELTRCLESLQTTDQHQEQVKKSLKLLVSGFINGEIEPIKYIEDLGGTVVADDLCGFSRYLASDAGDETFAHPLREISVNYLSKFCPVGIKDVE
ncbi:MAG: 2-hydroxyacyl-CoA dehydratase, partial [Candidatus Aminicenantes bacterium]